ncbi:MAG: hypothetical protein WBL88_07930 [Nitrososphaeraceae archaeon]
MEMGMTSTARITNLQMKQHGFLDMDYYPYSRKIMKACGLNSLPNRRTFDRRLEKISIDIKERISIMGNMFGKIVDPYIVSVDSTLLVFHVSLIQWLLPMLPNLNQKNNFGIGS